MLHRALFFWGVLLLPFALADEKPTARWAAPRDKQELVNLLHSKGDSLPSLDAAIGDRNVLVAISDHRVVGFVVLEEKERTATIQRFFMTPEAAAAGVGDVMVQEIARKVEKGAWNSVRFYAEGEGLKEAEVFQKRGFETVAARDGKTALELLGRGALKAKVSELEAQTYYERLGVPQDAPPEEIERLYQKRMAANLDPGVQAILKHARDFLLNEKKRAGYDETPLDIDYAFAERVRSEGLAGYTVLKQPQILSPFLYRRLGVPKNASPELIRQAYDRAVGDLVARHRPEDWLWGDYPHANGRFTQGMNSLDEALSILSRPKLREKYDSLESTPGVNWKNIRLAVKSLIAVPEELPSRAETYGFNPLAADAYEVVGLERGASLEQVVAKQNELRNKKPEIFWTHPEVDNAFRVLSNPKLKKYYDKKVPKDPAGKRALLLEMVGSEEKFMKLSDQEKDDAPVEPKVATEDHRTPWLYAKLGVKKDASDQEIKDAYLKLKNKLEKKKVYAELDDLEGIFLVLSNARYRRDYDHAFQDAEESTPAREKSAAGNFVSACRFDNALYSGRALPLEKFVTTAAKYSSHLAQSASMAKKYLQGLEEALDRAKSISDRAYNGIVIDLAGLIEAYPDRSDWSELHQLNLSIRTKLLRRAIVQAKSDPVRLEALLKTYLFYLPPDFLSNRLRAARDAARPAPDVKRPGCDYEILKPEEP